MRQVRLWRLLGAKRGARLGLGCAGLGLVS